MKTLKRGIRGLSAVLVAVVLLFGATQAFASADGGRYQFCPGTCPPLVGGMGESCWQLCEFYEYYGGDCEPFPDGDCCCVEK